MKMVNVLAAAVVTLGSMASCGSKTSSGEIAAGAAARKSTERLMLNDSLPTAVAVSDNLRYVVCKNPQQPVEIEFAADRGCLLRAGISGVPDTANVSFCGIALPDGESDTLTGRCIEYELAQAGVYRLSIGECQPQGEPWGGDFTFDIDVVRRVPYVVGRNYYVRNNLHRSAFTEGVISDREQFDAIFGRAAVMGMQPTEVDFQRQYVIAVVDNMSDDAVHLTPLSLVEESDGRVVLTYERQSAGKRSYSVRPYLMLVVERQYGGLVEIVAN